MSKPASDPVPTPTDAPGSAPGPNFVEGHARARDREGWLGLDREGLIQVVKAMGEPAFRGRQLFQWLHQKRATDFEAMSNLSKTLRATLAGHGPIHRLRAVDHQRAADGLTEKWLHESPLGGQIESVLIREIRDRRRTACVSCMVGCPLACRFCATGCDGFERNLTTAEIVEQIYRMDAACRSGRPQSEPAAPATDGGEAAGAGLTNIVFMGMGEPLLNLDAVLRAVALLTDPEGFALGGRSVTLSTVGVPEGIDRLREERPNIRLAWSLHAPDQALREALLPMAARWPLGEVFAAIRRYAETSPRRVTVEYCLTDGVNDGAAQCAALQALLRPLDCTINLIPLNPVAGYDGRPPPPERVRSFQASLEKAGFATTVRMEKGREIQAACGQLRRQRKSS